MNKLVIVAGATGGIGSALCRKINSYEHNEVLGLYRNKDKFEQMFLQLNIMGCMYEQLDSVFFELLNRKKYSSIILVLARFSILPIKRIEHLSDTEILDNVNANIVENINLINNILRAVKKYNYKLNVINFDSGAAYRALEGWSLYSSAKAYINMYLKSVIYENENVCAVSFDPGVVDTDMQRDIRSVDKAEFSDVEVFCDYKINNLLNTPEAVAEFVYSRYIENWQAEEFAERFIK